MLKSLEAVGRVPKRHYSYWLRTGSNVWQASPHNANALALTVKSRSRDMKSDYAVGY